jgi:pyruvate/2-oxoglutarate dehydrogenase complex dihydrolipoamide dehydrogenase (E3) component
MPDRPRNAEKYDALVLGSGEAGKYIAWMLASSGKRTAVVERRYIGGSCPNIACLPSKNFVHTAKVVHYATAAKEFGLDVDAPGVEMEVVRARKRAMVDGLIEMHRTRYDQNGTELIPGIGRFVGSKTIEVELNGGGQRVLTAETVVVSTGSRARIDSIPGMIEAGPLTHVEMLEVGVVPEHLVVIGGGYVGLEFAQVMRRLGSEVSIIERNDRLLHREDEDVSTALTSILAREGVKVYVDANVDSVTGRSGESVTVKIRQHGLPLSIAGTHLLVATGRIPNTAGIGLEVAGIEVGKNGHIRVNEHMETTAEGIYAVGDCAGSPYFTHIAYDDYRIVRERLAGRNRVSTGRQVPFCLFTDPELARVGLSESEAKSRGIAYRLARLPMNAVLRTRTMGESEGFIKALVSVADDTILGFTGLGVSTGEMMAPVQLAMSAGLPYTALRDLIITHPTFAEGLVYLFSAVPTR